MEGIGVFPMLISVASAVTESSHMPLSHVAIASASFASKPQDHVHIAGTIPRA